MKQVNEEKRMYLYSIIITVVLLTVILVQNFVSFYKNSVTEAEALGQSCLTAETEQLVGYINKGMDAVKVVSCSVEYMMDDGADPKEIERYITQASLKLTDEIDENFTGIYGVVSGVYIDGAGWVPDEDYVPEERDWYIAAAEANGEPTIVPPYVDAQTGDVIISLCKLLRDGKSVISLDIVLNNVQTITEKINLNNRGYGFIITDSGLVIAHRNQNTRGRNMLDDPSTAGLALKVLGVRNGSFNYDIDGEKSTVFTETIFGSWHVAMVVSNSKLMDSFQVILIRDVIISIIIMAIVIIFYTFAFKKMNALLILEEENSEKIEKQSNNIVKALAHTIDAKDRYTSGHSQRVAYYSLEIAKRMGKSDEELQKIYYAGLLHDVGKIRVPEEVINKPGKLTEEEFGQIKLHPIASYHILKDIYDDKLIADGARFHHERYDGRGYPNGLAGDNIPEVARIIGVADAYDAMASNRSYRHALPQEAVRAEIEKGIGKQFDPQFAEIMLQMIDEDTNYEMCESESADRTILVVDDEEMVHTMVASYIKDIPTYKLICASSGIEALNIIKDTPVDLVLLDIKMPGMDGFEVLKRIRASSEIPVVLLTGDKSAETISNAAKSDSDDYITKPFTPAMLREVIHSVLNA